MFEGMSQEQLMHKMFAKMMVWETKMACKEDIAGMEQRLSKKFQEEVGSLKVEQKKWQGQVEERITQFEKGQKQEIE